MTVFVGRNILLASLTKRSMRSRFDGARGITNATAIGADAVVTQSNSVVLGNNTSVGIGTSAPKARLQVQGGNIFVGSGGMGIILKSPNGAACRLLTINDSGVLITPVVSCP